MVLNSLGGARRDQGDLDGAIADFERSLKIGETLGDHRHVAMVLNSLGGALRIKGEVERALDVYQRLRNLTAGKYPREGKAVKEWSKTLNKWKATLNGCSTEEERRRAFAQYHLKLGRASFDVDDNYAAFLHLKRALSLHLESKEKAQCWFHLGRTCARLKQPRDAVTAFRASLDLAKEGNTVIYASLGHSLHEAGAPFDEIQPAFENAFKAAAEKGKENAWAHSWYALVLRENGQLEAAEQHARKADEIEPGNSVLLTNLGQVLMAYDDRAKLEEAAAVLERAQEKATLRFRWPTIHLATVRERLGIGAES